MGNTPLYLTLLAGPGFPVPVPKPVLDALLSAQVTESATGGSGFQLTFSLANNSPLQTFFLLAGPYPIPVMRVILVVSYGGLPQALMDGVVQHCQVVPDATSGSSKLVVTGGDLSALMGLVDLTGLPYPGTTPDQRVRLILLKYAAFGIVPEVIPVPSPDVPVPVEQTPVQHGTDLSYIKELASEAGYVFYVAPGPAPGTSQAYFGPQVRIGIPQPPLAVNMDAWTNVESLSFTYQPQGSVSPIVDVIVAGVELTLPIPATTPFNPPLGAVVPVPVQYPKVDDSAKLSPAQALMLGVAQVVENADVVTGEGTLNVDRYGQVLRARSLVGVRGAGLAFDGLHYVDTVTHDLKPGEYKQSFTLKRNALIASLPVVTAAPY
jgi:hypothetical protein